MIAPGPRFDRSRRDDLVSRRDELRYGEGYFNNRKNACFEVRPPCDEGDICTYCEYAWFETLWPPQQVDGDSYRTGCLGWVDCILSTTSCRFCLFLTKLFFDASPGYPRDQVVIESNRRRFCLWLDWRGREGVTTMQPRMDQWHGDFSVMVQEVSDFDLAPGLFAPYEGFDINRLAFRLDVGSRENFVSLMGEQSEEAAVLNLSRPIGRQWNSALFRDALHACRIHHIEKCEAPVSAFLNQHETSTIPAEIGESLLVVDVERECITLLPKDSAYVALSYCWSKKRYSVTTVAIFQELLKPGSLQQLDLPPTISDAMIAMRAIGERYIWIDSLCIVQDDHKNKAAELARMDDIYRAASLTIIAAATPLDGTEVGLPGVRAAKSRHDAPAVEIRGLIFRQCGLSLWHGLAASKWHSRAWTFQEYLLSKRYLVFMPEQVYFVCRQADFAEDHIDHICAKEKPVSEQSLMPCCDISVLENGSDGKESHSPLHFVNSYKDLVGLYTKREMSFDSDAVNAARGLLRLLQREYDIQFLCGLPVPYLPGYFLTWVPVGSSVRRGPSLQNGRQFPSWTWAGWQGEATYPLTAFPEDYPDDGIDQSGMHVELEEEITEWEVLLTLDGNSQDIAFTSSTPETASTKLTGIDHCYLTFTAEVACFSVITTAYGAPVHEAKPGEVEHSTYHQIAANGVHVGSVVMHRSHEGFPPHFDVERPERPTFVALSRAKARWHMWYPIDEANPSDDINLRYTQEDGLEVDRPPFDEDVFDVKGSIVNVLLVCTSETGISYRAGVGQIHIDAWNAASPEQKQILLG